MEERVYYSNLYDYYASLLTEIQREYFEEYYFNNLSLTEIAESFSVSKNAISKTLKEVNNKLDYYEANLSLHKNKEKISKLLDQETFEKIEEYI